MPSARPTKRAGRADDDPRRHALAPYSATMPPPPPERPRPADAAPAPGMLLASGTRPVAGSGQGAGRAAWTGTERYEIRRTLGEGGMGVVYEAFDRERQQLVAIKTLRHSDPGALSRIKQEFRTLAGVQHPNLVRLYELAATEGGEVFFTMELVRGTDFLN